jgi:CBS domain-containing protein
MTQVGSLLQERKDYYSVPAEATVQEAAQYLRDRRVRAVVVCDDNGSPVGVISKSDISDKVGAEHLCPSWIKVKEVMTPKIVSVTTDTAIEGCLQLMDKNDIYHLAVVGSGGESLGMISEHDLLHAVATDQRARADLLENWAFQSG